MTAGGSATPATTLQDCEAIIERGLATFYEVGKALLRIRDERLYKATHGTFEDYCVARWGWHQPHAQRMIDAAKVSQNLLPDLIPTGISQPTHERQLRPLVPLPAAEQREVWARAVEQSNGKPPTAREIVQVIRERVALREPNLERPTERPTGAESARLRELHDEREKNSLRVANAMRVIQAIETLDKPPIDIPDFVHFVTKLYVPDEQLEAQMRGALKTLSRLLEEL